VYSGFHGIFDPCLRSKNATSRAGNQRKPTSIEAWLPVMAMVVGDPEKDRQMLIERSPRTYINQALS
jgi:hypothetical protein